MRDKISTFDNETASLRGDNANMALQFKTINSELQSLREQVGAKKQKTHPVYFKTRLWRAVNKPMITCFIICTL